MNDAPLIVLKELAGNPPPQLNAIQAFFAPHTETLVTFWWALWILTSLYLAMYIVTEYRARQR